MVRAFHNFNGRQTLPRGSISIDNTISNIHKTFGAGLEREGDPADATVSLRTDRLHCRRSCIGLLFL